MRRAIASSAALAIALALAGCAPAPVDSRAPCLAADAHHPTIDGVADMEPQLAEPRAKDGTLVFTTKPGVANAVFYRGQPLREGQLCVDLRLAAGPGDDASGGIAFWAHSDRSYFFAELVPKRRQLAIWHRKDGKNVLLSLRRLPAVNADPSAPNELRVEAGDAVATVEINGVPAAKLERPANATPWNAGLRAASGPHAASTVEMTNWTITQFGRTKLASVAQP